MAVLGICGSALAACSTYVSDDPTEQENQDIVRGKVEKHFDGVVAVRVNGFNGNTLCTGTYIADRVVLTAAHCIRPDAISGQTFVYFGNDYNTDVAQLPSIPAPGKRSKWARAETTTVHPQYDPSLHYPDMAVLLLDRDLPVDPIRIERRHVKNNVTQGKVVGWGASKALTPDLSQVEGAGIKRSADVKIVGSPTAADFHPEDPNNGILDPAIRANQLKIDGRNPRPNTCAGDSGGPLLIADGCDYKLAGVSYFTGLSCEDYGLFTRLDPFLDFIDAQVELAGRSDIKPRLECVEPKADGSFKAHFGYDNDNAVTVNIPYGSRNLFPKDTKNARPSDFIPGDHAYAFSVDFGKKDTLKWELSPKHGPSTLVKADRSSPQCDPNNQTLICSNSCEAQLGAKCFDHSVTMDFCTSDCVSTADLFQSYFGCGAEWNTYLRCTATVPAAASNWDCSFPGVAPSPVSPNCDAELAGFQACAGF